MVAISPIYLFSPQSFFKSHFLCDCPNKPGGWWDDGPQGSGKGRNLPRVRAYKGQIASTHLATNQVHHCIVMLRKKGEVRSLFSQRKCLLSECKSRSKMVDEATPITLSRNKFAECVKSLKNTNFRPGLGCSVG